MKERIINICPAPAGYNALYAVGEPGNRGTKHIPIVCLALVEITRDNGDVDESIIVPMIGAAHEEGSIMSVHDYMGAEYVSTGFFTGSEGEL